MEMGNIVVVHETSDPEQPLTYVGIVLGHHKSDKQSWIVLDTDTDGQVLFIDNQFQSCTRDEHIYHETFVHSAMVGLIRRNRVLLIGGGEGCLLREVLRWKDVERVVQVDWDESLVDWYKTHGRNWNEGAYSDPRAEIICADAFDWLRNSYEMFDAIFVDLLDPSESWLPSLSTLLQNCKEHLAPGGLVSINAGKVARETHTVACKLAERMKKIFPDESFDHAAVRKYIPSFLGEWCFLMSMSKMWSSKIHETQFPEGVHRLTKDAFHASLIWPSNYPPEIAQFWRKKLDAGFALKDVQLEEHYGC